MRTLIFTLLALLSSPAQASEPATGRYVARAFTFASGEALPEVTLAYTTLGTPHRDAAGAIDNAVMLIHGTGASGKQFLAPQFQAALFGPGQPLDAARTYIILPDMIGHGGSSKPSDALRMAFPAYDYADMVSGAHRLLTEHLGVTRLKAVLGTSMGCMVTFQWGTTYPDFAEKLIPMACYPSEVGGQNRMWRKLAMDAIKGDPAWAGGRYGTQPVAGMRAAASISMLMAGNPIALQANLSTRAKADAMIDAAMAGAVASGRDANDAIYQFDASRTYNPWDRLGLIRAPVLWINFADDLINPPALGFGPKGAARMKQARFLLIPASAKTQGHLTLAYPEFWADALGAFLAGKVRR